MERLMTVLGTVGVNPLHFGMVPVFPLETPVGFQAAISITGPHTSMTLL